MSSIKPVATADAPATLVLTVDSLQPARGGMKVRTGLRAGKAKTADKAYQQMDAYIKQ